jgi:hypothetical protein
MTALTDAAVVACGARNDLNIFEILGPHGFGKTTIDLVIKFK